MPTTYYLCCCCYYTYYHLFHHRYCYSYYILCHAICAATTTSTAAAATTNCCNPLSLYNMYSRNWITLVWYESQIATISCYCLLLQLIWCACFSMIILFEIVAYAVWTYSFEAPKIVRAWRSLNCLPQIRLTQWYNAFSKPSHEIGLFWPTPQLIWAYMSYMRCRCQTRLTMDMTLWICKAQSKPLRGESGLGPNYQHQTDKGTQRGDTLTVNEP